MINTVGRKFPEETVTNCMTTKYHSNQLNRRERVLQTMVKYDPELYKEIIQYLQDDNYYNPL